MLECTYREGEGGKNKRFQLGNHIFLCLLIKQLMAQNVNPGFIQYTISLFNMDVI